MPHYVVVERWEGDSGLVVAAEEGPAAAKQRAREARQQRPDAYAVATVTDAALRLLRHNAAGPAFAEGVSES